MTKVNSGNDVQARQMGGDGAGYFGTATATSATSLTGTGTPFVAGAFVGHMVVAASGVYGVIISNTTSVLTVDQWYNPATRGGAAGSTPASTTTFSVLPGNAPADFIALSTTNAATVATDTTMAGEITTATGGLKRQLAVYAHTLGVAGYTLTGTWTANGADTLPATAYRIGVFNSIVPAALAMLFETLLSAPATFNASGDQLVVTESVSN